MPLSVLTSVIYNIRAVGTIGNRKVHHLGNNVSVALGLV